MNMLAEIRTVLASHGRLDSDVRLLSDSACLFGAGLTSFASVQVLLGIEERFGVEFPICQISRDTFGSVEAIARSVRQLLAANAEIV